MSRPRASLQLTKKQRRRLPDFNSEAEQRAAAARGRLSKKIQRLRRRGPSRLLSIVNTEAPDPETLMAMQRLIGRRGAPWIYDERLALLGFAFLRAVMILGQHLPRRYRGDARALALGAAAAARQVFRQTGQRFAAADPPSEPGRNRAVALMIAGDLQHFFEWLMHVDPAWLARVRRCRGCHRFFWDETIGRPKETCNATCRQGAYRAARRAVTTG